MARRRTAVVGLILIVLFATGERAMGQPEADTGPNPADSAGSTERKITSIYTEISVPPCTVIPASGELGDGWDGDGTRCKGPSGYELLSYYVDDRAGVEVISPDGARHDINILTSV